jgi:hypothetical protein
MKPTAYVLFLMGLVFAGAAALSYLTPTPSASAGTDGPGELLSSSAFRATLWVASACTIALAVALLRFGGKGYTVTGAPPRRGD